MPDGRRGNLLSLGALLVLAAVLVLFGARPSAGDVGHNFNVPASTPCAECHTLSMAEGETGTSFISAAARTLPTAKAARSLRGQGYTPPTTFGCTFCHYNSATTPMKGLHDAFGTQFNSKHAVGITFAGADTLNDTLTGWNVTINNELDCIDCHDPALLNATGVDNGKAYADHADPLGAARLANPNMLRNTNVSALCRTCHGDTAALVEGTVNVRLASLGAHGDGSLTPIQENDGTAMRQTGCDACHLPHSSGGQKLFDTSVIDMGVGSNCYNAVCHYRGDANDNFEVHGHGMARNTANTTNMNFECNACHSVNGAHNGPNDVTNPKMFNYTEDTAVSAFGKSVTSVCYICHGDYTAHTGGGGNVSCLDCHDEHAEGVGSTSNDYMIPLLLPNNHTTREAVTFDLADAVAFDYYRGDGAGICDNLVCHSVNGDGNAPYIQTATVPPQNVVPLSTFMTSGKHTGSDKPVASDCKGCHDHGDVGGSWSASGSCDDCHGQPPVSLATTEGTYTEHTEANSPHARHALTPPAGYGFACQECHGGWTGASHDTLVSLGSKTYASIWFDQTRNPLTTAYNAGTPTVTPDYNQGTETCANLYCHSNGATGNSVGSQQWMGGASTPDYATVDLGCGACHAAAPTSGSHTVHISAGAGCQNCHFGTTADGTTIDLAGGLHVNRAKNVSGGGTFSSVSVTFGWTTPNCTAISCHGGSGAAWGGTLSCYGCHSGAETAATKPAVDTVANPVTQAQYEAQGHGQAAAFPGSGTTGPGYVHTASPGCYNCHDTGAQHFPAASATDPFRLGAYAQNTDGLCAKAAGCHTTAENQTHMASLLTGGNLNGNWYGYDFKCVDCHDPHGDGNYYMIRASISAPTSTSETNLTFGSDSYGTPRDTANASAITFTSLAGGTTANSYGVNTQTNGLCEVCHVDSTNVTYYRRGVNETNTHNTAGQCTSCHKHNVGLKPSGCSGCHGGGTAGTVQKNFWPDTSNGNAENTAGAHLAHMEALSQKVYAKSAVALLDDAASETRQKHLCSYCHANPGASGHDAAPLPADVRSGANNAFGRMWLSADPVVSFDSGSFAQGAAETCSTVDCHYRKVTPAWYSGTVATCSTCHAASGYTVAASLPMAHDKHAGGSAISGYSYACTQCHPTNAALYHANNTIELSRTAMLKDDDADATFTTFTSTVKYGVAGTYATCNNVYCHGDFTTPANLTGGGNVTTPTWNGGAAAAACGSCHGLTTATVQNLELLNAAKSWPRTGSYTESHNEHVRSNSNPNCSACHDSATGTAGLGTYGDFGQHANGTISNGGVGGLVFGNATAEPTTVEDETSSFQVAAAVYNDTVSNGAATGGETCSNVRCHNGVTTPAFDLTGGANITCGKCHNETWTTAGTRPTPTGLASVAGSHAAHVDANDADMTDCQNCHANAGVYSAVGGNAAHQNLVVNVGALGYTDADGRGGVNYAAADGVDDGTCSTSGCHPAATPAWGSGPLAAGCFACHGTGAEAAALGGAANSAANQVSQAEWQNTGHGLTSGSYDLDAINDGLGNAAANLGCADCHSAGAQHAPTASSADPFRLGATYQDNPSGLCTASCHTTTATNHHNDDVIANGATAYDFETKCIDCHDPHGDSNMFMVHSAVAADGADADTPKAMSSTKGVPDTTKSVTFVADTNGTDYADTVSPWVFTGICEVCHTATRWYQGQSGGGTFPGPQTGHTYTNNCSSCHAHSGGFKGSGCDGCHGDEAGSAVPNGIAPNGAAYPNQPGAHAAHVAAIGTGNSSCDTCHPGNPPATHPDGEIAPARLINHDADGNGTVDADAGSYKNLAGSAIDNDGRYNQLTTTCLNINCHGGVETPPWGGDVIGPVFSPDNVITVSNPNTDGDLQISWNAANDATVPVRYDLYRLDAATAGDACTTGALIAGNLGVTSYFDSPLTNGTNYRYCVTAKDGVTPSPNTTNTTSAHAAPSAPAPGSTVYYLSKATGTVYGATNENMSNCSTAQTVNAAGGATTSVPPGLGILSTTLACASTSTNNYVANGSPANGTFEAFLGFYKPGTYAVDTTVTGATTTGNAIGMRGSGGQEDVDIRLVSVTSGGVHTPSATATTLSNIGTTLANQTPNMSGLSVLVPAGNTVGVVIRWNDTATTVSGNDRITVDNYNTTLRSRVTLTETPAADTTAPAFPANNSGITAVDAGTGGAATLNWVAATDAYPSNPVRYTVYAVQSAAAPSAATLFNALNIVQQNITATSTTVTGLAVGNPWWFGVRAKDAANNVETANTTISSPGVTPSGGGGGGATCATCHGFPPASHGGHADNNADYSECVGCHTDPNGGTAGSYFTAPAGTHNNGSVTFAAGIATGGTPPAYTCTGACHTRNKQTDDVTAITWSTTAANACNACHYYRAAPTSATNIGNGLLQARHGRHFDAGKLCSACHTVPTDGAHASGTGADDWAILQDRAAATYTADVAGEATLTMAAYTTYDTGTHACSGATNNGLGCHATGTPDWDVTFAVTACLNCHTNETTTQVNPTSGLHNFSVATRHDDTLASGNCINCHTATATRTAVSSLHQDGTLQNSGAATFTWHANVVAYNAANGCQASCHSDAAAGYWNRRWVGAVDANPAITDNPTSATVCGNCHGSFFMGWRIVGSTSHVNPDVDNDPNQLADVAGSHGTCGTCHGFGTGDVDYTAVMHDSQVPRYVQMNSEVGYQDAGGTAGQCTTNCHGALTLSMDTNSGWTVSTGNFGGLTCEGCHAGSSAQGAAGLISMSSTHTNVTRGVAASGCAACHPSAAKGAMHAKNGNTGVIAIPNYTNVQINFAHTVTTTAAADGGVAFQGFVLGGTSTTGTSEAEICWNCHAVAGSATPAVFDGTDPSEWGTNSDTNGTRANYNFGTLSTISWFTGTWTSGQATAFAYKTGKLTDKPPAVANGGSTHTANPTGSPWNGPSTWGVDTVAQVRCSYCHAVHTGTNGDGSTPGAPFLRGTWQGNPYREDGAPRSGISTYGNRGSFQAIPRGNTAYTEYGGYQIDQNNANPTTGWTLATSAGLCAKCHGTTADGTWTAAEIDNLDQFTSAGSWVGTNGHSAAVLGGGNASAFNLLSEGTRRHPTAGFSTTTSGNDSAYRSAPFMAYKQLATASQGYGFRGQDGLNYTPSMNQPYAHRNYNWGATIDIRGTAAIQSDFHQFSCSKCHNPHASRLPRLMISNCLDTKNNTYDNAYSTAAASVSAVNASTTASNWTSAQNCHRRRDPAFTKTWVGGPAMNTDGWNNVTPW